MYAITDKEPPKHKFVLVVITFGSSGIDKTIGKRKLNNIIS